MGVKTITPQAERMWAGRFMAADAGRVSREYAMDYGLANPKQYPSWPEYPDARDRPEAVEARAEYARRVAGVFPRHTCGSCGVAHLTTEYPWHDEASRLAHLQGMAEATSMTVGEVEARLAPVFRETPHETPHVSGKLPTKLPTEAKPHTKPHTEAKLPTQPHTCPVCLTVELVKPDRGPMPTYCSRACEARAARARMKAARTP